jgi:hypothetical protein
LALNVAQAAILDEIWRGLFGGNDRKMDDRKMGKTCANIFLSSIFLSIDQTEGDRSTNTKARILMARK